MYLAPVLYDAMHRLAYLKRVRLAALTRYRKVDNPRQFVRCSEVTKHVAELLDVECSPNLGHDVRVAMKGIGWRFTKTANVFRWKGVVAR
jgi:hypothetical protein